MDLVSALLTCLGKKRGLSPHHRPFREVERWSGNAWPVSGNRSSLRNARWEFDPDLEL